MTDKENLDAGGVRNMNIAIVILRTTVQFLLIVVDTLFVSPNIVTSSSEMCAHDNNVSRKLNTISMGHTKR